MDFIQHGIEMRETKMFPGVFSILTSMEKETSVIMSGTVWHSHYDIHYSTEPRMHCLVCMGMGIYILSLVSKLHSGASVRCAMLLIIVNVN